MPHSLSNRIRGGFITVRSIATDRPDSGDEVDLIPRVGHQKGTTETLWYLSFTTFVPSLGLVVRRGVRVGSGWERFDCFHTT